VAIISFSNKNGSKVISDVKNVYHPEKGKGIHPREASRHHAQIASSTVSEALSEAKMKIGNVDVIAFSQGPGLGPCLRVGAVVARSISSYYQKPLTAVNHAIGHIELACMLTGALDPLVLLVSGGHTVITSFSFNRWRIFGETLDITVGQLIDQFGREAGFSSPFGKEFEELSCKSNNYIELPYTVKGNDVSFSGLLTSAKKLLSNGKLLEDICYSIQENSFTMLAEAVERALAFSQKKELLLVGGVAANIRLQNILKEVSSGHRATFFTIPRNYSGDCGAQIAWTGLLEFNCGNVVSIVESSVKQSWRLDEVEINWRNY
jgi:N6-L-threonylcarbamoyladenine synthase